MFHIVFTDKELSFRDRMVTAALRPITITRGMKAFLKDWLKYIQQSLLNYPVANCRYSKLTDSAIILGYFNPNNWQRAIVLSFQFTQKFTYFII